MENKSYREAVQILSKSVEEMKDLNEASHNLINEIKYIEEKVNKNNSSFKEIRDFSLNLSKKIEDQDKKINELLNLINAISTKIDDLSVGLDKLEFLSEKLKKWSQENQGSTNKREEVLITAKNKEVKEYPSSNSSSKEDPKELILHEVLRGLGYKEYIRLIKALTEKIPSKVILNSMSGSAKFKNAKFEEVKSTFISGEYKIVLNEILKTPKSSKHKEIIDKIIK
jgi:septal ring factor EnvC (AmiA/AmiB activator)